jgi:hypothetical protein
LTSDLRCRARLLVLHLQQSSWPRLLLLQLH